MSETELKPIELKVTLVTNIPGSIETNDYEKDILTFSTLNYPELKIEQKIKPTKYPYFSYQVKYEESVLSALPYTDIISTFFVSEVFMDRLGSSTDLISKYPPKNNDSESLEQYYIIRKENINNNVMLMIRYLLPTKFPVVNNHFTSYDLLKGLDSMNTLFYNPSSKHNFTYFNLSSGRYTLKKVIWLNDFLNQPDYKRELLNEEEKGAKKSFKVAGISSNNLLEAFLKDPKNNITTTLQEIRNCYKTKCSSTKLNDLLYVGMQLHEKGSNQPLEIFLDVELIESELKPDDEANIKCPYYGDYLGEELLRLIKESKPQVMKKMLKGQITKMPLYNPSRMVSKKLGDAELEAEKVDEELANKRKQEDIFYNDIDIDARNNYESVINGFLDEMERKKLKIRIKRYDINKKNLYRFLDDKIVDMLEYISLSSIEKQEDDNKLNKFKYNKFRKIIDANLRYYSDPKIRIGTGENDKNKLLFELTKELLDFITPPELLTEIKEDEKIMQEEEERKARPKNLAAKEKKKEVLTKNKMDKLNLTRNQGGKKKKRSNKYTRKR